ncbi:MAG TPA: hypothetical protein VG371_03835 [Solirubrobacteraceae bacterium]|nr:hypothetical protein [Solirubrobacteraceae bacterium]
MRRLIGLGLVALVVVVLGIAQLVLPGIAAQRLRDQLSRSGRVLNVQVSAFPAIELLWRHADKVVIRMARYRSTPAALPAKLNQAAAVGTLDVSAQEFADGLLTLHDARLVKRGNQLTATATVDEADLRSAVPILTSVTPVASGDGRLTLRGTASLFGFTGSVDATVSAQDGKLVVAPGIPFFPTLTLFSDPHIGVESVSASPVPGGFAVQGTALLH